MDTSSSPIAILDSGIGGLPYLERIRQVLPDEYLAYFADSKGFPYGLKSPGDLTAILVELVGAIVADTTPKALVLACNTASVVALASLRSAFNMPVVGVVPAVKPAVALSKNRRIGLLATGRTVLDSYTDDLIESFAADCHIVRIGDGKVVEFVESRIHEADDKEIRDALGETTQKLIDEEIDTVVLGCTHFIFIRDALLAMMPEGTTVVDSRDGVAKQVGRVIDGNRRTDPKIVRPLLYITEGGENEVRYESFAKLFGCTYGGVFA